VSEKTVAQKLMVKTDIHRDIIREHAESLGMKAVELFSIDETWSSLRLKIG
jgi:hypothetical protein